MFRIVLFEPEIPPNTGNVIRLCANTGAELHLVKPLGFDLDRRSLRRAGLDYRWMARVHVHPDFDACERALREAPAPLRWCAIETGGTRRYDEVRYREGDALLFGSEDAGLTNEELRYGHLLVHIPVSERFRSINLSHAVMILCYEIFLAASGKKTFTPRLATSGELEGMYGHIRDVSLRIGFINPQNPEYWMTSIRRFLSRVELRSREVKIIRGFCRQLDWFCGKQNP